MGIMYFGLYDFFKKNLFIDFSVHELNSKSTVTVTYLDAVICWSSFSVNYISAFQSTACDPDTLSPGIQQPPSVSSYLRLL